MKRKATRYSVLEFERAVGGSPEVTGARFRGQEYLLERRLFRRRSTGEVIERDRKGDAAWTRFAFPTWWHYDVLRGLEYLRRAGVAPDERVAEAIDLAQDFAQLVRQRQPEHLDPWLQRAATSTLEALRRFATGLYEDHEAVNAGVTLPWSTGPVEGHINRLKMVKRQMFGRARLDRLSRRFVRAPACGPERSQPGAVAASSRVSNTARRDTMPDVLGGRRGMRLGIGRRVPDRLRAPLAFHVWISRVPCALPTSPKMPMSQPSEEY